MKKNIALITGGLSRESIVSYQSADSVIKNIDDTLFNLYKIDLKKDGWFYENELNQILQVNKEDFSIIFNKQIIKFDGVFICIHGNRVRMVNYKVILICYKCPIPVAIRLLLR